MERRLAILVNLPGPPVLPCLIFEDDHLLVVNKPPGLNTHAPSPFAGEGLYDWLRHREPRWAPLAIIQRLDKETSGLIAFSKTPLANRSLTDQFSRRTVRKKYLLLTDRPVPRPEVLVRSSLVRSGERYLSRPLAPGAPPAETRFRPLQPPRPSSLSPLTSLLQAEPLTGRTHQIRVHAADRGFPILGDTLYGGTPAPRLCLHAVEIQFQHPSSGNLLTFRAPVDFEADPRALVRAALIEPESSDAYRLIHGAADGHPGWYVDRLGPYLLSQSDPPLTPPQLDHLAQCSQALSLRGVYHKRLTRHVRAACPTEAWPQLVLGEPAPERFTALENGLRFELSFGQGYSVGLFLDQRDNRRRLLTNHVAAGFPLFPTVAQASCLPPNSALDSPLRVRLQASPSVLNTFAYTCGFSVCAAKAGARTTSLDLSRKFLEWGRRNFALNGLDPAAHEFICGDAFDGLRRLAKNRRRFDVIMLDPPTFSTSKEHGVFRAEKDYGRLVAAALPLLAPAGLLFASTNAADWPPEKFLTALENTVRAAKRRILQRHYAPQPPDFPVTRAEPAYLKTVWLRLE